MRSAWIWFCMVFFIIAFPCFMAVHILYPNVVLGQGSANRIFYIHIGLAWGALYGPLAMLVSSLLFLKTKKVHYDWLTQSLATTSMIYCVGVLYSGPIWAKQIWNVYWDWGDLRLQTFFILSLMLGSYFFLRKLFEDVEVRAIVSAALSILLAINVVLVWLSIRIFKSDLSPHPGSVLEKGRLDPAQWQTLFFGVGVFLILFILLCYLIYHIIVMKEKTKQFYQQRGNY